MNFLVMDFVLCTRADIMMFIAMGKLMYGLMVDGLESGNSENCGAVCAIAKLGQK